MLEKLFFKLLLPLLLLLIIESSSSSHELHTKCGVCVSILLPLDLVKFWAEVKNLSEHHQSKALSLSHRNALLNLLHGNPVGVSGSKVIES